MIVRRSVVASVAAVSAVVSSGCSLPSRDNPNDPAAFLADPIAKLEITSISSVRNEFLQPLDLNGGAGPRDCSNFLDPDDESTLATFSRGRCIVMDASASTPGEKADADFSEIRFFIDGGLGEPIEIPAVGTTMKAAIAGLDIPTVPWTRPLDGTYPADEVQARDISIEVRVTDSNGNTGVTSRTVTLTNSPPSVVAPAPLILQDGGAQWNGSDLALNVRFDASASSDPDEDRLFYCWRVPEEFDGQPAPPDLCADPTSDAGFSLDSSIRLVRFTPNVYGAGINSVSVVVSDGVYHTGRQYGSATMGFTPWWGYEESSGSVVMVDVNRVSHDVPEETANGIAAYVAGGGGFPALAYVPRNRRDEIAVHYVGLGTTGAGIDFGDVLGDGSEVVALVPNFTPQFSNPTPPNSFSRRLWAFVVDPSGQMTVSVLEQEQLDTDFSLRDTWAPDDPLVNFFGEGLIYGLDQVSRDDHYGDIWFSTQFGDRTFGLHLDWATQQIEELAGSPIATEPGLFPSGIGISGVYPQGGGAGASAELWILYSRNVLLGGNTAVAKAVARPPAGSQCYPKFEATFDESSFGDVPAVAWGLAFTGSNEGGLRAFWTNLFSRGLAHVVVEPAGDSGCEPVLKLETLADDVTLGFQLFADEQIGQVSMVEDGNNSIVRMVPGGHRIRSETKEDIRGVWQSFGGFLALSYLFEPKFPGQPASLVTTVGGGTDGVTVRTRINPAPLEETHAIDVPTGYLWSGTILPAEMVLVDPSGRVIDTFDAVDSEDNLLGPPIIVRSDPASGAVAVFTTDVATSGSATKVFHVDPLARRASFHVARSVPGFTAPDAATLTNIPSGYRIVDAAFQASYAGSRLVALAIDPAASNAMHLVRFTPDLSAYSADVPLADLASGSRVSFARDLASGEIALAYRSTAASGLVLRRFDTTLGSSAVYDFGVGNVDPWDVSCLRDRCYVLYDDGGGDPAGLAQVANDSLSGLPTVYVFDTGLDLLPSDCREVHTRFSSDDYPRIIALGQSGVARLQAQTTQLYEEETFVTDGRIRLFEP